jgi:hypothetical protein
VLIELISSENHIIASSQLRLCGQLGEWLGGRGGEKGGVALFPGSLQTWLALLEVEGPSSLNYLY